MQKRIIDTLPKNIRDALRQEFNEEAEIELQKNQTWQDGISPEIRKFAKAQALKRHKENTIKNYSESKNFQTKLKTIYDESGI